MENYEINNGTLAIIPINEKTSKVYEENEEILISKSAYEIMENSCSYFGSSLSGRQLGSKNILGSTYKIPIVVDETRDIIFFPTSSPALNNCQWIGLKNIKDIKKSNGGTLIIFDNNKEIYVDIPYLSIQNQVLRATRLNAVLKKRQK